MGEQHHHHHVPQGRKKIAIAFFVNLIFTIIEIFGGIWTNSLAILSDAVHDLGDTLALASAWYLEKLSDKRADKKFTYGYRRFSVLGALINSLVIIVGSVLILRESIPRIFEPNSAHASGMIMLSVVGIVFNAIAAYVAREPGSLNNRVVSLHLLEDVLGWVAVLIGSVVMYYTNWEWIDPVLSVMISLYIGTQSIINLRKGLRIVMQGTPDDKYFERIKTLIREQEGVESVHDIRIWTLDGSKGILSAHIVVGDDCDYTRIKDIKARLHHLLNENGIVHCTLEAERDKDCPGGGLDSAE